MNRREAQEILLLHRPGAANRNDPQIAAALEYAKGDPELAKWFDQHCALDESIRAKFRQIPVPAGLKEQILSERKARGVIIWWRRPAVLAAAACVALLLGTAGLWLRPHEQDSFLAYRRLMVRTALRTYSMDLETNDLSQIRAYLAQKNAHPDYVLPQPLEKVAGAGCVALKWHGNSVAMVCFRSGKPLAPGEKSDLFLFVIDGASVPGAPRGTTPRITKVNKLTTASWSRGNKVYVLAAKGDAASLLNSP